MKEKPNVVIIYADDLGYGDLSCYGAEDIRTPNVDLLATEGIRFDNAYSTSAVCTPARYSLLTGQYPFRNPDTRILPGNAKCIISKDTLTQGVPSGRLSNRCRREMASGAGRRRDRLERGNPPYPQRRRLRPFFYLPRNQ